MTDDEWDGVALLIDSAWKGDFDDAKSKAYQFFLGSYDEEVVLAALSKLVQSGKPFLPAAAEIAAACRTMESDPVPSWSEAWTGIRRCMSKATRRSPRSVGISDAMEWAEKHLHEVVVAFIAMEDLKRLLVTEFYDPDYGGLRIKELEGRWRSFAESSQDRLERGLALRAVRQQQIGPRQFRPELGMGDGSE